MQLRENIREFFRRAALFYPYLKRYRRYYLAGLACLIVVDLIDVALPLILGHVTDMVVAGAARSSLAAWAGLFVGLSAFQAVGRYLWRFGFIGSSMRSGRDLRREYYAHLLRLSQAFFHRSRTGDLMALATNDIQAVRQTLGPGILISVDALLYLILIPPIMLSVSPLLTACVFITFPLLPFFVRRMGSATHRRYRRVQEHFAGLTAKAQESISGIRIIKAFRREEIDAGAMEAMSRRYVGLNLALARIEAVFRPVLDVTMSIGVLALLVAGGYLVIQGRITPGDFVSFQRYIGMMIWPMMAMGWTVNLYQRGSASFLRLRQVMDREPEIEDGPGARPLDGVAGRLTFKNLTFAYPDGRCVLQGIDLEVPPRTTLGIVGEVGSGKSTLASLIPRLQPVAPGQLFLDGQDVTEVRLADLRRRIGYVPQETFLFSDSIRDNILFGVENGSDDPTRRAEATARQAAVHHEIEAFPDRYDSLLGERGLNLSGGQRQRVAIARALARDPAVLVLDEALSSVDTQTEEEILRHIQGERGRRTVILIAHRLSTVRHADQIVVLSEGRIVERGRHHELVALGGRYAEIHRQQQMAAELERIE